MMPGASPTTAQQSRTRGHHAEVVAEAMGVVTVRVPHVRGGLVSDRVPQHGTYSEYTNHRCHCDPCKAANTEHQSRRRDERVVDDWAMHGRESTYTNYRCKCDACRAAHAAGARRRRAARRAS